MKTNEELAAIIQNGDNSKTPELWDRVRNLYAVKSLKYYHRHRELCDRCGVDLDDIQQQSFFAFLRSVEEYDPQSGLSFTAFIDFPFRTEMQTLTGMRTEAQRQEPLNNCDSLDRQLEGDDGSDGSTLHELIADPSALDYLDELDDQSVGELIRAEVDRLPEQLRAVITAYYFDGLTHKRIAENMNISLARAQQIRKSGLFELSKRRALVDLWNEYNHTDSLRRLEQQTRGARPDSFGSARAYTRATQPRNSVIDRAEDYAEDKRRQLGKAPEDWTRADKIEAMLEYLRA